MTIVSNAYLDHSSVIHLLDPRTKIVGFLILSVAPFVFNSPPYVASISLLVMGWEPWLARWRTTSGCAISSSCLWW